MLNFSGELPTIEARAEYRRERVHLILEIRSEDFEPCKARKVLKGLIKRKVFIVHVREDGHIHWDELP